MKYFDKLTLVFLLMICFNSRKLNWLLIMVWICKILFMSLWKIKDLHELIIWYHSYLSLMKILVKFIGSNDLYIPRETVFEWNENMNELRVFFLINAKGLDMMRTSFFFIHRDQTLIIYIYYYTSTEVDTRLIKW